MIRIDAAWLATQPLDMRAGTDTALARVVANKRANRMKVLVHDGICTWLAPRRPEAQPARPGGCGCRPGCPG